MKGYVKKYKLKILRQLDHVPIFNKFYEKNFLKIRQYTFKKFFEKQTNIRRILKLLEKTNFIKIGYIYRNLNQEIHKNLLDMYIQYPQTTIRQIIINKKFGIANLIRQKKLTKKFRFKKINKIWTIQTLQDAWKRRNLKKQLLATHKKTKNYPIQGLAWLWQTDAERRLLFTLFKKIKKKLYKETLTYRKAYSEKYNVSDNFASIYCYLLTTLFDETYRSLQLIFWAKWDTNFNNEENYIKIREDKNLKVLYSDWFDKYCENATCARDITSITIDIEIFFEQFNPKYHTLEDLGDATPFDGWELKSYQKFIGTLGKFLWNNYLPMIYAVWFLENKYKRISKIEKKRTEWRKKSTMFNPKAKKSIKILRKMNKLKISMFERLNRRLKELRLNLLIPKKRQKIKKYRKRKIFKREKVAEVKLLDAWVSVNETLYFNILQSIFKIISLVLVFSSLVVWWKLGYWGYLDYDINKIALLSTDYYDPKCTPGQGQIPFEAIRKPQHWIWDYLRVFPAGSYKTYDAWTINGWNRLWFRNMAQYIRELREESQKNAENKKKEWEQDNIYKQDINEYIRKYNIKGDVKKSKSK